MPDQLYMPILQGRAAEFGALARLPPALSRLVVPCIDVTRPRLRDDAAPAELTEHLGRTATNISRSWGSRGRILVDMPDMPFSARTRAGVHPVTFLCESLVRFGVQCVPVTNPQRDEAYQDAVRQMARVAGHGLALRLLEGDIVRGIDLQACAAQLELSPEQIDLIIDLRYVRDKDEDQCAALVTQAANRLSSAGHWRSVSVTASNAPRYLSEIMGRWALTVVRRREWTIWRNVRDARPVRTPMFGDYGIIHPYAFEPRGAMTISPSVRYTTVGHWLMVRGQPFDDRPGSERQYHVLAQSILNRPEFRGEAFSYGDDQILRCALRERSPGNPQVWITLGLIHHFTFVCHQLTLGDQALMVPVERRALVSSRSAVPALEVVQSRDT